MATNAKQVEQKSKIKKYKIQYPISDYKFPSDARIEQVRFDDKFMHVTLTDERVLSIPLHWIPTLRNAKTQEREKFEISQDRTMIIWKPERCAINDEISILDFLGPSREEIKQT